MGNTVLLPLFVQLKEAVPVQTLCLCKLIIASNMLQQDVIQVVSPNAKAKQMTMKSLLHALWIAYFAHFSHQIITRSLCTGNAVISRWR